MRNLHWILCGAILAVSSHAVAQEETPEEGATPEAEDSSVNTVNEPVKEATNEVQQEMHMKSSDGGAYGSAGCGLGSLLFEPSNGFTQVFAATTNGTSGTQTFGITSGTSNCDGAGYQPGAAAAFIQTNRAALAKDIARGKGATISALTDLAGCANSKAVGRTLKSEFKTIFPGASASDQQVSDSLIGVLQTRPELACTNLG